MLKRLSGSFSQSSDQLLLPPVSPGFGIHSPAAAGSAPSSPHSYRAPTQGYPFPPVHHPSAPPSPGAIDRTTLHKTLSLLSALLVALDDLRSASLAHSKAHKRVGKAIKDLGVSAWGDKALKESRDPVLAEALLASAAMYDTLGDVDLKLAKVVQSEYESVNDHASRSFKKTAKEEKTYEESLGALDAKVSKATVSYNKHASKPAHSPHALTSAQFDTLTSSHSNYVETLQNLQVQATELQRAYGEQIAARRETVGREVARCLTGLAEKSWRNRVEATRKGGETIGRILARGVWVGEGMQHVHEHERRGAELRGRGTLDAEGEANEKRDEGKNSTPVQPEEASSSEPPDHASRGKHGLVRGPRAPSTSTTNTQNSTSASTSMTASLATPPSPQPHSNPLPVQPAPASSIAEETTRFDAPQWSATTQQEEIAPPRPPLPPTATSTSHDLGGGRTLPRGWYLDPSFANHLEEDGPPVSPRLEQSGTSSTSTYDVLPSRGEDDGTATRPTPRHGSAPDGNHPFQPSGDLDEWGRGTADTHEELEGQQSFVRRMSQKYGGGGEGDTDSRYTLPSRSTSPPSHNRSNSRVSLLAKRYSSPPEPTRLASSPDPATSPPRRPLPPPHRPYSSVQVESPRAGGPDRPPAFSRESFPSIHSSSHSQTHALRLAPDLAAHPSTSTSSHGDSSTTTTSDAHPPFCACQSCTTLHYARPGRDETTRADEERLQRELRIAGGGIGNTLRGLVGKGREVFGRMG
ncbi:hypothetical protein JCM11491_005069 [Sporobolomyces phaffii]